MNDAKQIEYRPVIKCPTCGHEGTDYAIAQRGPHTSIYCSNCHTWIKHLSKDDKYRTQEKIQEARNRTNNRCAYCGEELNGAVALDHVFPKAKGGGHNINNLYAVCKSCNSSKGKKTLEEYRSYLQRKTGKKRIAFYFEQITDIDSLF